MEMPDSSWHFGRTPLDGWLSPESACYILPRHAGVNVRTSGLAVKSKRWLALLLAFLLMPPSGRTQSPPHTTKRNPASTLSSNAEAWVKSTHEKMTPDEKLGQLLMVFYHGEFTSAESHEFSELARIVEQHHVGGLMVETRSGALGIERSRAYPTAALANLLQSRAKIPLLIAAD